MTGSATNKKRITITTASRVNGSPTMVMKSNVANWYSKPNPISKVPTGMPNLGFVNVIAATRKARRIGSGCGKSGISDNPKAMLARVITNVRNLSGRGSSARSFCSFSFLSLNHVRTRETSPICDFNYCDLKPYFTSSLLKLVWITPMENCKPNFDVLESIKRHVALLKPLLPSHTIICIGEYPMKILFQGSLANKTEETLPIFIDKSTKEITKWRQARLDPYSILGLDEKIDSHFWFQVLPHVVKNESFMGRLRNKLGDQQRDALMVASIWDGVGSAFLPALISQFAEWKTSSVALTVLPSKIQPSDAHFNAFSAMGMCASKESTPVVLIDRDRLENYVGVDRSGTPKEGNTIVNYLLELMLIKDTLVQELSELSRAFNAKIFTILAATGASFKIYGALENILNAALFNPFLTFDLSSASVLYVLIRMPLRLKDKLPRGKIELTVANWFKKRSSLNSIYVTEPIYVEDVSDRIDLVMFVGGFDLTEMLTSLEKKVNATKNQAVKKGWIKEEEWKGIVKSLTAN